MFKLVSIIILLLCKSVYCGCIAFRKVESAIHAGDTAVIANLLADNTINSKNINQALNKAIERGKPDIVDLLLKSNFDPGAFENYALYSAIEHQQLEIIELLLKDGRIDPAFRNNYAMKSIAAFKNEKIMQLLLETGKVDPTAHNNRAIILASKFGNTKVVKLLLNHPNVDPSAESNLAFQNACQFGNVDVVKLLLRDKRVNPADNSNAAILKSELYHKRSWYMDFTITSSQDQFKILKLLLEDGRADPAARDNQPLRNAIFYDRVDLVQLLLSDKRVDPNSALRYRVLYRTPAKTESQLIMKSLLKGGRANPALNYNEPLKLAIAYRRTDLLGILLADKRVNPADFNNEVVRTLTARSGYSYIMERCDMLELLMKDGRADLSFNNNELYGKLKQLEAIRPNQKFLPKLLLQRDERVNAIEYLTTARPQLTSTKFLNLINSPLKWGTPSYIAGVFSQRSNDAVALFLAELFKIPLTEARNIRNLDDMDKYIFEIHKDLNSNDISSLSFKRKGFLWRYYGATIGYKGHFSRFQELTISMLRIRDDFRT